MRRWFLGFTLSAFAALLAISPALAASAPAAPPTSRTAPLAAPAALPPPAAQPSAPSHRQHRSVLVAQAPFATVWNSTVVAANSQAMGLQTTHLRRYSPIQMAVAGAAVGAIVGAVVGDPLTDAAIGGGVGFGIGYVMHH